jgi:hypothetical protein
MGVPTGGMEVGDPVFVLVGNPIDVARHWLGPRLTERPGGYWLDGGPVNLKLIMQAVNRIRVNMGIEQITLHETWRCD